VVIPTYRRWSSLSRTLAALESQKLDSPQFEVIVSDDGSNDGSFEQIERYLQTSPLKAVAITNPNAGPAAARNRGARLAQGKWIVFIDDDCFSDPDWLDGSAFYLVTANAVYLRPAFEEVGGFDTRYPWLGGEDPDLSERIRARGLLSGHATHHPLKNSLRRIYLMCRNHLSRTESILDNSVYTALEVFRTFAFASGYNAFETKVQGNQSSTN
jgi:glycosyltransferase involved in cell wall biosynthesis